MTIAFKLRKSAGVPVTAAVHRLLTAANRSRDAQDWPKAAEGFRRALELDPGLAHIWIQYGHASRERGDLPQAELAYRKALALKPASAEPHLHLGHVFKARGDIAAASRSYLQAAQTNPDDGDALSELHRLVSRGSKVSADDLMALLQEPAPPEPTVVHRRRSDATPEPIPLQARFETVAPQYRLASEAAAGDDIVRSSGDPEQPAAVSQSPTMVFDVSDLISYFCNARLPTGIQRVQIETISSALRSESGDHVLVCAFVEHRDDWMEIPAASFLALCDLSLADGDATASDWHVALTRLQVRLSTCEPLDFPVGAYLINLGTSWWLQNYFLFVRQAKMRRQIRYVPFIHDFIPVMASEHCTRELTQDFISWAIGAFDHADFFMVNSEATKRDLLRVAGLLGHQVQPDAIAVVRLDADFRKPSVQSAPPSALARWGLGRTPFVLFVSTIESRKNHVAAFEAWIALIRQHGLRAVPKLVCVGNRGWLNAAVYAQLEAHDGLRDRVVMLSSLSDAELALLYESCLFTLYPSRYEGWGLPVTESLCFGKLPVVSDASSLPEAGGPFAVYFESGSVPRLTDALDKVIFDTEFRQAREAKIAQEFRPRSWADITVQMADSVAAWAKSDVEGPTHRAPLAHLGAYHPIVRNVETKLWARMRSGEVFRAGAGWWGPDLWGCWTKPDGGNLDIRIPDGPAQMRVYLKLHGLPKSACPFEVRFADGTVVLDGVMAMQDFKWIALDLDAPADRTLRLIVQGFTSQDLGQVTEGKDPRTVSIGVSGFFLCDAEDMVSRTAFLEAVSLSCVEDLAFNRQPGGRGDAGRP